MVVNDELSLTTKEGKDDPRGTSESKDDDCGLEIAILFSPDLWVKLDQFSIIVVSNILLGMLPVNWSKSCEVSINQFSNLESLGINMQLIQEHAHSATQTTIALSDCEPFNFFDISAF